eukprot:8470449-Pyramimonas_sp.AAC.1
MACRGLMAASAAPCAVCSPAVGDQRAAAHGAGSRIQRKVLRMPSAAVASRVQSTRPCIACATPPLPPPPLDGAGGPAARRSRPR